LNYNAYTCIIICYLPIQIISDAAGAKLANIHKRLSDIDAQGALLFSRLFLFDIVFFLLILLLLLLLMLLPIFRNLMCATTGAEAKAINLLVGLGFTQDMLHMPVKSFRSRALFLRYDLKLCHVTPSISGGWKMRVALAQALYIPPHPPRTPSHEHV
jgi:hypothetical protein